jgi:hypothetical protein
VQFNRLPRETRERLVASLGRKAAPWPLLSNQLTFGIALVGWGLLALTAAAGLGWLWLYEYGRLSSARAQSAAWILLYSSAVFVAAYAVLAIVRRSQLIKALPFPPGRYVLPIDFVDARGPELRLTSFGALVDFKGVHHHTNGAYSHTELSFRFDDGSSQTFSVRGKAKAEEVMESIREARQKVRDAVEARDVDTLVDMDPFIDARVSEKWDTGMDPRPGDGPVAGELSPIAGKVALVALGAAAVLGPSVWLVRGRMCDEAAFAMAKQEDSVWGYEGYLEGGGRHAQEVRSQLLPRAALVEAQKKDTVTALREVIQSYPGTAVIPEARASIHRLFVRALESFRHEASSDPRTLKFMEGLLAFQEKRDSPALAVRFHRPQSGMLQATDAFLTARSADAKGGFAPVAPHFDDEHATPREAAIVSALQDAFKAIIPGDILSLERVEAAKDVKEGESKDAKAAAAPGAAIDIGYDVKWSGSIYSSDKSGRRFVGIRVPFDVAMRVPEVSDPLSFAFAVEPPDHFEVSFTSFTARYLHVENDDHPSDDTVYEVMASRAFDQLHTKLRGVFFREAKDPEPPPTEKTEE